MRGCFVTAIGLLAAATLVAACGSGTGGGPRSPGTSTAYKGHQGDVDMQAFIGVYHAAAGTRLDDRQTCHRAGDVIDDGDPATLNPCSFCHLIPYPDGDITGGPAGYADTLNPYGLAYKAAGRDMDAVRAIGNLDSDGDTFGNTDEVLATRYPGDPASWPGQAVVPTYTFEWADVLALTSHTQFLLMNSHRQQFDDYATYEGVRVSDILAAAGADLSGAASVTILAPDGYAKDFSLAEVNQQYADGLYYADLGPAGFLDPNQGFVTYPPADQMPAGMTHGGTIPNDQWMLIAHHRDGALLDASYLDPVSGKINGEGPYRVIVPQTVPGSPDRGSKYSPTGYADGWDYDDNKDHNAGLCVRGVVAIRINPLPAGLEEFDWKNGGWALASSGRLIVYGSGVTGN